MTNSSNKTWNVLEEIRGSLNSIVDRAIAGATESGRELHPGFPPVDIFEDESKYYVLIEAPGMSQSDIKLSFEGNALTVSGEKPSAQINLDIGCHRAERVCGAFSRTVPLPGTVDGTKIVANYNKGLLSVTLPKAAAGKARNIEIEEGPPAVESSKESKRE
jgi:HSP20 family molecular chaperone IbpA